MTLGISHVAFARQAIAEQRERIARLKAADCSTVAAEQTLRLQIPPHRGQSFRCIADSVPVIADSCR